VVPAHEARVRHAEGRRGHGGGRRAPRGRRELGQLESAAPALRPAGLELEHVRSLSGACNGLVGGSRWADQRGYFDPAINAVRTHSAPPEFPPCPQQEIPHFQDRFDRGDTVHFGIYHRDLLFGQDVDYSVRRPDGSTALAGTYSSLVPHYAAAYALPSYELPARATVGVWRIVVDYDGRRYERPFEVHSRPRSRRVSGPPR